MRPVLPAPLSSERSAGAERAGAGGRSHRDFLLRVLTVAAIAALLFLFWKARDAVLLAVASLALAVLLDAPTRALVARTGMARPWALTITGVALALLIGGFVWLVGREIQSQAATLTGSLDQALRWLERSVGLPFLGGEAAGTSSGGVASWAGLARTAAGWGFSIVGVLTTAVLVVVGGFFLAADPRIYRRGLVKLFPKDRHAEAETALDKTGLALRQWLIAEVIAMTLIGALAGLGTWAIGLEAPLALGLFAGLAEFIPIVGPIIGAAPALLLAATQSWSALLWTLGLYVAIQQLESNVITPVLQRREVTIPPALLLLAVFFFGLLFGALGVIVAAPLTIILYALVRELYVRRTLGERPGG